MEYKLNKPCNNCPFLKKDGVRLHPERAKQIAHNALGPQGGTFACHKTTIDRNETDDEGFGERSVGEHTQHCAGALIFSEKHVVTQMMRIAERLRMYDASRLEGQDLVFDTVGEMVRASREAGRPRKKRR
jgi:hypothetical protein